MTLEQSASDQSREMKNEERNPSVLKTAECNLSGHLMNCTCFQTSGFSTLGHSFQPGHPTYNNNNQHKPEPKPEEQQQLFPLNRSGPFTAASVFLFFLVWWKFQITADNKKLTNNKNLLVAEVGCKHRPLSPVHVELRAAPVLRGLLSVRAVKENVWLKVVSCRPEDEQDKQTTQDTEPDCRVQTEVGPHGLHCSVEEHVTQYLDWNMTFDPCLDGNQKLNKYSILLCISIIRDSVID